MERLAGLALIVACLLAFGGAAGNGFVNFDDGPYVYGNAHVQAGITVENVLWAFKTIDVTNWHPLTWLSHMLDCELYGLNPAGHHLTSLFFHILNSLLLCLVLKTATGRFWESFIVSTLFALHPLRVESVVWISERKDVLSMFFGMLTMLAYIQYVRTPAFLPYFLALLFFALGLMAKPMLVSLPFVLLLFDYWPLNRFALFPDMFQQQGGKSSFGRLLLEKTPFLFLSAASCVVTFLAQYKGGAVSSFEAIPLKTRVLNAFVACCKYLGKIFWPQNLAVFYPHPGSHLPTWEGVAAALFLLAVSILAIYLITKYPFFFTGWFWFLGMLVPVLGIIQVGGQSMADRYTYLPSIGILIAVVWSLSKFRARLPNHQIYFVPAFIVVAISLGTTTSIQTRHWKNTETLFAHAISVTTNNYLAHNLLGDVMAASNRLDAARVQYEKALAIWPQYPEAHNNLGMVLAKCGQIQEAMDHYVEALKLKPSLAMAHVNLAALFAEQGNLEKAEFHYREALRLDPDSSITQNGLGVIMAQLNRMDEAVSHLSRAIELCPKCAEPKNNLGRVLTILRDYEGAAKHLEQAIKLAPTYAEAYNNMAVLLMDVRAFEEAMYYASAACHLKEDYEKARKNMRRIAALLNERPDASRNAER